MRKIFLRLFAEIRPALRDELSELTFLPAVAGLLLGLSAEWGVWSGLAVGVVLLGVQVARRGSLHRVGWFGVALLLGAWVQPHPTELDPEWQWAEEKPLSLWVQVTDWPLPSTEGYLRVPVDIEGVGVPGVAPTTKMLRAQRAVLNVPRETVVLPGQQWEVRCQCALTPRISPRGDTTPQLACWTHTLPVLRPYQPVYLPLMQLADAARSRLGALLSPAASGIAAALLTGDRRDIPQTLIADYRAGGGAHLLAVSGQQLSLILTLLLGFWAARWRRLSTGAALLVAAVLLGYGLVAGLQAAVVRALVFAGVLLVGRVYGLRAPPYNLWLFCVGGMLLARPAWLYDVGFQLSAAALVGVLWPQLVLPGWGRNGLVRALTAGLGVSVGAWLCTLPVSLYHYGQFPLYAAVANLLVLPLSVVVLPLVLLLLGVSLLGWPALTGAVAALVEALIGWQNFLFAWVAGWPGALRAGVQLSVGPALGFGALLLLFTLLLRVQVRLRHTPHT